MLDRLFRERMTPLEVKKLLLLLAVKGESENEIEAAVRAVRAIEGCRSVAVAPLLDVCGTGGDGLKSFNISTVSGFVIAGAGGYVAKHGNRAVSSQTGSSDLMEALGVRIELPPSRMMEALQRFGFGYFHAPYYHSAFAHLQSVRKELGVRTLLNALGPLLNPVEIKYQVVGVSNPRWMQPMAKTLARLGRIRAAVIRSREGLDELSLGSPSDILYVEGRRITPTCLNPKTLGFSRAGLRDCVGGGRKRNRELALGILTGSDRGARRDIVLLNSGFGIYVAGLAPSLAEGVERARRSLESGKALAVLERFRQYTRRGTR